MAWKKIEGNDHYNEVVGEIEEMVDNVILYFSDEEDRPKLMEEDIDAMSARIKYMLNWLNQK